MEKNSRFKRRKSSLEGSSPLAVARVARFVGGLYAIPRRFPIIRPCLHDDTGNDRQFVQMYLSNGDKHSVSNNSEENGRAKKDIMIGFVITRPLFVLMEDRYLN